MIPRATYRLQFHRGFTFADGARLAPYLARLGISHVYSSPIQTARAGSMHGYDVVDHAHINPELGGADGFEAMAGALQAHGIGIVLDIVPNHMCVADPANGWWLGVLENGRASPHATYFDIDWENGDPALDGKVFVPFLGQSYGETLASGALKLQYDPALGKVCFAYHHHRFALRREDYPTVLDGRDVANADFSRFQSQDTLAALLDKQNFALGWWRTAGDRINWRRFFDISELAALRIEDDAVFDAVHALPLDLYRRGLIDGLRVDHVDGLADPQVYCRKLRGRLADLSTQRPADSAPGPAYLVVEKILADGEELPSSWEVDGTTGYDFLAQVSALQHDPKGLVPLRSLWCDISSRTGDFDVEARLGRSEAFAGFRRQLRAAAKSLARAAEGLPRFHDLSPPPFEGAIVRLVQNLQVYRSYATGQPEPLSPLFRDALEQARENAPEPEQLALDFIAALLQGTSGANVEPTRDAARRLNQLSSAIAAKGVEDTAFYRYGVLLSRNDVGSDPGCFSIGPNAFHALTKQRAKTFPNDMLATATHDHKRGEDARARLAVLSEIPDEWSRAVEDWFDLTSALRTDLVDDGDVYQFFQTLVGAWPLTLAPGDENGLKEFHDRIRGWRIKSLREAKLRTSWSAINESFEKANRDFVSATLDPARSGDFLRALSRFVDRIAPAGAANGLTQTVLRLTMPGVPDTYQGTEFWDFSLVDPDNRRAVDFDVRAAALESPTDIDELARHWRDGRIKQAVIARILAHRKREPGHYARGEYIALKTNGLRKDNVIAFARRYKGQTLIVAVARCCIGKLGEDSALAPDPSWWADTCIQFPEFARGAEMNILQPSRSLHLGDEINASDLFSGLPVTAFAVSGEI